MLNVDHTKDSMGKSNGRAVHRVGSHTIILTVILSATCSLPFSFKNLKRQNKKTLFLLFLFRPFDIFPFNLKIQWLSLFSDSSFFPSFSSSPSSSWLIKVSNGALFQSAMAGTLSTTYAQPPNLFPLSFSFMPTSLCFCLA